MTTYTYRYMYDIHNNMGESLKHIDWKKADIKSMQYILLHIKNSRKIRIKWLSLKGFILTKKGYERIF